MKKRFSLGSKGGPIFNLDIKVECLNMNNAKQDKNGFVFPGDVKNIALAINYTEEIVVGPRHVTDKGYLVNGWKGNKIPTIKGTIDVMKNLTQLLSFSRTNKKRVVLSFNHKEGKAVGNITLDKKEGIIFNDVFGLEKEIRELRKTPSIDKPKIWGDKTIDEVLLGLDKFEKQSREAVIVAKEGCPNSEARRH